MLVILLESPRRERASSNSTMLQLSHHRTKTDILHISLSKYSDSCLTLCDKPDCYLSMWNIADKSVDSTGRQTKKLIGKYNDILPDLQLQTLTKKWSKPLPYRWALRLLLLVLRRFIPIYATQVGTKHGLHNCPFKYGVSMSSRWGEWEAKVLFR